MGTPEIMRRFAILDTRLSTEEYNYKHFRTRHLLRDGRRTLAGRGIRPGELAPDFELPQIGGGTLRLRNLHGTPVLLHFGSYS